MRSFAAVSLLALIGNLAAAAAGVDLALVDAVKQGNPEVIRALLQQQVDVNAREVDGTTALHWAVQRNDLAIADRLIRAGANVAAANRYGVTPLRLAATNGNAALIVKLVEAGADPNAALPEGETVLMTAARTGTLDAVRVLLDRGADVNARESWFGETALMWAASENHRDVARLLAGRGAHIDARSDPLTFPQSPQTLGQMVTTALPRGDWTALMYAARQGAVDAARMLAEEGASLDLTDPTGHTALTLAVINAHYDLAAMLVEHGANPNIADDAGMTPLYAAVDLHWQEWMFGRPAPKWTDRLDAVDLVKILLDHGADPNAALTRNLLQRHHDAGDPNLGEGTTPLMRAAKSGDLVMMRLLLDRGADPNLAQKNRTTPLMIAAGVGHRDTRGDGPRIRPVLEANSIEAIRLFLALGLDINAVNDRGETALHGAALRGADLIVSFLAEHGAKLDAVDRGGATPLDLAVRRRQPGVNAPAPRESTAALLRQLMAAAAPR
jgi:ankyrin repeat protein